MRKLIELFDAVCDTFDRNDFKPNPDGSTFCNQAVHAIASKAFNYNKFLGMTADQIVEYLTGNSDWAPLPIAMAQDNANNGSLVVAGLSSTDLNQGNAVPGTVNLVHGHGHVVVIRPGIPVDCGKWNCQVPRCVNIGASDFIARGQSGVMTNLPVGVNEAFVPMPKFWVMRSSL